MTVPTTNKNNHRLVALIILIVLVFFVVTLVLPLILLLLMGAGMAGLAVFIDSHRSGDRPAIVGQYAKNAGDLPPCDSGWTATGNGGWFCETGNDHGYSIPAAETASWQVQLVDGRVASIDVTVNTLRPLQQSDIDTTSDRHGKNCTATQSGWSCTGYSVTFSNLEPGATTYVAHYLDR